LHFQNHGPDKALEAGEPLQCHIHVGGTQAGEDGRIKRLDRNGPAEAQGQVVATGHLLHAVPELEEVCRAQAGIRARKHVARQACPREHLTHGERHVGQKQLPAALDGKFAGVFHRVLLSGGDDYFIWLMTAMSKKRSPNHLRMNIRGLAILPAT